MGFMEWNEKLSVNDRMIDDQHQRLIDLANQSYDAVQNQAGKEKVESLIKELILYVQTHFSHEEKFMKINGYPKLQEHLKAHQYLSARAGEVKKALEEGKPGVEQDLFELLQNWLIDHILSMDKQYAEFFASSGRRILPV